MPHETADMLSAPWAALPDRLPFIRATLVSAARRVGDTLTLEPPATQSCLGNVTGDFGTIEGFAETLATALCFAQTQEARALPGSLRDVPGRTSDGVKAPTSMSRRLAYCNKLNGSPAVAPRQTNRCPTWTGPRPPATGRCSARISPFGIDSARSHRCFPEFPATCCHKTR